MNAELNYLVTKKEEYSVAHCLDFDLVTTAKEIEEAIRRLDIVVRCRLQIFSQAGQDRKAPDEYWEMFRKGTLYAERTLDYQYPSIKVIEPADGFQLQITAKEATALEHVEQLA